MFFSSTELNKAMRRILCIPYKILDQIDGCWLNGGGGRRKILCFSHTVANILANVNI